MIFVVFARLAAITALIGASTAGMTQQTNAADRYHSGATMVQATPPAEPGVAGGQAAQPGQPGMMPPGMMRQDMMGGGMRPGMAGGMRGRGHMLKFMFAIADTDGDGALTFEEVTTIHKRIFDSVDANKDGKVTLEEVRVFMRE
jgi:EF hand